MTTTCRRPATSPTDRRCPGPRAAFALLAAMAVGAATAAVDDSAGEALRWAVAAALATADAVREHCPTLAVDAAVEARLIASTGLDSGTLRGHESYRDQAAAETWIRDYAAQQDTGLACDNAIGSHEDVAPGLVRRR